MSSRRWLSPEEIPVGRAAFRGGPIRDVTLHRPANRYLITLHDGQVLVRGLDERLLVTVTGRPKTSE